MASSLPVFPPFDVQSAAQDIRWKKWLGRLENLLIGLNITSPTRKRALLLHYAGVEVDEIFDTLSDTGDNTNYDTAVQKLTEYFAPKKNPEYEVYKFRQTKQSQGETIDAFTTRLRQLSITCDFTDNDKEIKSQIIQGCVSSRLRRKALREDMTLTELIKQGRAFELSDAQAGEIEKNESVHLLKHKRRIPQQRQQNFGNNKRWPKFKNQNTKCRNCGGEFPHQNGPCPAKGKSCNFCHKQNHFAKVCRARTPSKPRPSVRNLEVLEADRNQYSSDSDQEYVFGVNQQETINIVTSRQPRISIKLDGLKLDILVDTGSSINVIDESTYLKIPSKPRLSKTSTNVFAYGSENKLPIIGKFDATIESADKIVIAPVFVAKGNMGNLLSYETSVQLQIIPVISTISVQNVDKLCEKYSHIFTGIGKLKDTQIKLHVDESIQPVVQPHRRIPFHVRKQVEAELARLEGLDIIEKVDGPTPWVSPIVVAPKPKSPGQIRICVDMRLPNKAIQRERHITPTMDDMIHDLNGGKVFSKLDLNCGYHQLELSNESRNITTFTTHVGLRRYKRLSFGISSAAEIFQNTLRTALEGLKGVRNISDDIIVFGNNQTEHDENFKATFARLSELNLTLNRNKCEFNKDKLEFYGYVFGSNGISADPKKVEAIKNAERPQDASGVRSFLGMTNYVARFIQNYSTITEPLRQLTKKNTHWSWDHEQEKAFTELKDALTSDTIMAYFDPRKNTKLIVDASPVGLGAIMTQDDKIIAYASRSLTEVETRYSQTEREALAIVWGCEHFHLYLFGHKFMLISDHQPLEVIFNNPKSKPPARIERWRLRLQQYDFSVQFKAGKSNAADYISRHPNNVSSNYGKHSEIAEGYVNYIVENVIPKAMCLEEIVESTKQDELLQYVMDCIDSNVWPKQRNHDKCLESFYRVRSELTVANCNNGKVLLCDRRLVIPKSLQMKVIGLAHEGHQGIVKTKQLLREKVWFPGIDKKVEDLCSNCIPCLASVPSRSTEPLHMTELPIHAWSQLSLDFCGPFPSGDYLLVLIDDYSRYPVVEVVSSVSSRTVIPVLDKIFAMFGVPDVVKTDNGPPFNGHDFAKFAKYIGFIHQKVTPLWPQANGEAERFMRTIGKSVRAANAENRSWKQAIYAFLRNYRATPHGTTSKTPAEMLFGRKIKTKIPEIKSNPQNDTSAREFDRRQKEKMKQYADSKRNAKTPNFDVGDNVLVKQSKHNKLSTPYDPNPFRIIEKKGTMVTASRDDQKVTRNSSFFKAIGNKKGDKLKISETDNEFENQAEIIEDKTINDQTLRRSERERKPPDYLKDYVKRVK